MGKIVLVTGGCGGIGKAIVEAFVSEGHTVYFSYFSSKARADALSNEMSSKFNSKCIGVKADISDTNDVKAMISVIEKCEGKIDVLVNCAGTNKDQLTWSMTNDDWNKVIDTNLTGTFLCCKESLMLLAQGTNPSIVNISSVSGIVGTVGQINYSASKAGVISITKTLAKEIARMGITVNSVAPGLIDAGMVATITDARRSELLDSIPLGRLGKADEVAALVKFLSGEDARYITGQTFVIDGGMTS